MNLRRKNAAEIGRVRKRRRAPIRIAVIAAIFFFYQLMGEHSQSSVSSSCAVDFETIDGLTAESRAVVQAFAKNASDFVRSSFKTVAVKQNEALLKSGRPEIPLGTIEPIEARLLPAESRLAGMVNRVNFLFQDEDSMTRFVEVIATQAAGRIARQGKLASSESLLTGLKGKPQLLQNLASEQGWGPMSSAVETMRPDEFRTQILGRGQLWYDIEGAELSHTGSAHALQWIYVTPILEKEFGPGAAKELLRYFSTPEGFPLWESLFDRGPLYFRDFRAPRAFNMYRLAGPHSWFGVQ